MQSSSGDTDDLFHPAISASASGIVGSTSFSYYHRQQELLKSIEDARGLLAGIIADHCNERVPLLYPKSQSSGEGRQSRSRSESRRQGDSRFTLIGLAGTRTGGVGCGAPGTVSDLSVLEEGSLGRLLLGKLEECRDYLGRMSVRVKDKSSRVLVTGDVNGGKSTLINALLSNPSLLPMDQQPCTQAFCEIVPVADQALTVHAIPDYDRYKPDDPSSYDQMSLGRMQSTIQEEDCPYQWYRVRTPPLAASNLLSNDLVSISLIDSPGLNSDLFKTMNLFARQEEIDVVLFVVSAANHLTLSAREFLETAGKDKAYIFIVVNKFDDIRNKEKCRRVILSQIADVLPATAAESSELVHFVSAKQQLGHYHSSSVDSICTTEIDGSHTDFNEFKHLKQALSDFILSKRTRSKLLPAKTYLCHLLQDLTRLFEHNERCCQEELHSVRRELDVLQPCYEELVRREAPLRHDLLHGVSDASKLTYTRALGVLAQMEGRVEIAAKTVQWRGLLAIWSWRRRVTDRVAEEARRCISEAQAAAVSMATASSDYLYHTANAHAASVFASKPGQGQIDIVFDTRPEQLDACRLPTWSLFDPSPLFSLYSLVRTSAVGCLAGGSFYLIPHDLVVRSFALLRHSKKLFAIAVLTGALVLTSTMLLSSDVELMARRRLNTILHAHYSLPSWQHSHAHAIESACHQHLLTVSGSLLNRFQEALAAQRRLRTEKDLVRAQLSSQLEQILTYQRRVTLVHDTCSLIDLA